MHAHATAQSPAEMQKCAEECHGCFDACTRTIAHCLGRGGEHTAPDHIRLLMDCAEICQTSHNFLARGSDQHANTCRACAAVCTACAEECERMGKDDPQMTSCAARCRRCAESCGSMAGAA